MNPDPQDKADMKLKFNESKWKKAYLKVMMRVDHLHKGYSHHRDRLDKLGDVNGYFRFHNKIMSLLEIEKILYANKPK